MAHYFLILDITDWPINGVLWMKPFYTSEMHGQKSWRRQRLPIWVCEVERWKILERMRVSWVRSTARQVGVQSGDRAEQQGTSGGKIKIVLISLPPSPPPSLLPSPPTTGIVLLMSLLVSPRVMSHKSYNWGSEEHNWLLSVLKIGHV